MDKQEAIVEEDVTKALKQYLGANQSANEEKLAELLDKRIREMERAKADPDAEQVSMAIQSCPGTARFSEHLQRLRVLQLKVEAQETKARMQETLKLCPGLCIQFEDLAWDEYYGGESNIKYPDVRKMTPKFCKGKLADEKLKQKMMLFDLLQGERSLCCHYDSSNLTPFEDKLKDCPAIIIPSSGKSGTWLGEALSDPESFWWVRCKDFAHVIFVVSNEELKAYEQFPKKGVTVVGYEGFGMGCGRAAGVHIANKINRACIMTDDRTKGFAFAATEKDLTQEELATMMTEYVRAPFITGVTPKGELNILTVINPSSTLPQKPIFSPYFIASKEDKALYLYCQARQCRGAKNLGSTSAKLQVRFDARNPAYKNTAPGKYLPKKGSAMECITSSQFYCSLDGQPLNWKHLNGAKGFQNPWDAVKMQDSAMYLLLKEIVDEIKELKDPEAAKAWEQFDKYINPWFT